jgi:TolA-binding protein
MPLAISNTEKFMFKFIALWIPTTVFSVLVVTVFSGCMLDTRSQSKEQDEKSVMRKQVANLQQSTADVNSRFADVEEDVRKANGRIEALETRLQRAEAAAQAKADKGNASIEAKLGDNDKGYREEFSKLHSEIDALKAQLNAAADARRASDVAAALEAKKDPFDAAESKFESKSYKEAILDYQNYRKKNPSGKHFSTATYKIGSSFQELGMNDDARAFYEEVISKFPKSKDAGRAQAKLKALKKK